LAAILAMLLPISMASGQDLSTYLGLIGVSAGPTPGTGSTARLIQPTLMLADGANGLLLYDSSARTIYRVTLGNNYGTLEPAPVASGLTISAWALDPNSNDIILADATAHVVRRLTRSGGATVIAGVSGSAGSQDGPATTLGRLNRPEGVLALANGDIYIADTGNHLIRKLSGGQLTSEFGSPGQPGTVDGTRWANGSPGVALLNSPRHLVVNGAGEIFWVDNGNSIRSLPSPVAAATTTVATNLAVNSAIYPEGNNAFVFASGHAVAFLPLGGSVVVRAGLPALPGSDNGPIPVARLTNPYMVLPGPGGSYIISDSRNNALRRLGGSLGSGPAFTVGLTNITVEVGNRVNLTVSASTTGTVRYEWKRNNTTVQINTNGNYLVTADALLTDSALFSVTVRDDLGTAASSNIQFLVTADDPQFNFSTVVDSSRIPSAINSFALGTNGWVYFAEPQRHVVSRINTTNGVFEIVAGFAGLSGVLDGVGGGARFNSPHSVALDAAGNIYVTDQGNHTIRKVTPSRQVTTLSGAVQVSGSTDGLPVNSRYTSPSYLIYGPGDSLSVLDAPVQGISCLRIRTVDATGNSDTRYALDQQAYTPSLSSRGGGILALVTNSSSSLRFFGTSPPTLSTPGLAEIYELDNPFVIAGALPGNSDGTATNARFGATFPNVFYAALKDFPRSVVFDSFSGTNDYIVVDTLNHSLRRLRSTNVVTTVAGGTQGYRDGLSPLFDTPAWGQMDSFGSLWILDGGGRRIRKGLRYYRAPVITSPSNAGAVAGESFNYQIVANGLPTSYGATGLPGGLFVNGNTGLIYGIPNQSGTFAITLRAVNRTGTGTLTLTLTVDRGNSPVITSSSPPTAVLGEPFVYQITATGAPTRYDALGLPPGISVDKLTGVISGTPTQVGTYAVTLSAWNAAGFGSLVIALTVSLHPPPVVTSPASAIAVAGQNFTYQVTATGAPTTYLSTGLPAGLRLDPTSGLISGNLTVLGNYTFSITAANSWGTDSRTVTLTVTLAVEPSVTLQPRLPTQRAHVGGEVSFTTAATGTPLLSYLWRFNNFNIPGGDTSTLRLQNLTTNETGEYHAVIANSAGVVFTEKVYLEVDPAPFVHDPPRNQTVPLGAPVTLGLQMLGEPPFAFQWRVNGTNLPGETNMSLSLAAVNTTNAGRYSVAVTNAFGGVVSEEGEVSFSVSRATNGTGGVALTFPAEATGFVLESSPTLGAGAVWTVVTNLVTLPSGQLVLPIDPSGGSRYHRLRSP
jgi:hypothetical protein